MKTNTKSSNPSALPLHQLAAVAVARIWIPTYHIAALAQLHHATVQFQDAAPVYVQILAQITYNVELAIIRLVEYPIIGISMQI